ncbi:aminotransferase class I/II-fold pyridoxal phosphate-dependent enzyme [Nocardioides sp. DS6]|uniref:Aminotransferase n=1 Tax=Nocardioides eburneus TaxID=3231482 RepID=A0ABV3SYB7_9ACTN
MHQVDLGGRLGVAQRANVPPFHVMDMIARAAERQRTYGDAVSLMAGQPSTGAPRAVTDEAVRLLHSGDPLGYTPATGILELRRAIADHHRAWHGLDVDPDEVVVTTGASGGFLAAFLAAFDTGAKVALARPTYPCYRNVLVALGCEVVEIPTGPATRFQPSVEQVAELHERVGLAGLVVASPANPTGTMLLPAELAALAAYCEEAGIQLISDEIYHGISYDTAATADDVDGLRGRSAWETSREAVVFGSFSKYFSMTGWRIGWMLVPQRLRRAVDVLVGNFTICPPALAQYAAVQAFTPAAYAELDGHVARYAANRRLLLDGLRDLGVTDLAPADGAFYVYADVSRWTEDTMAWSHRLLDETGVAVAPGIDFDTVEGHRFVRLSFAGAAAEITAALDRLSTVLGP